MSTARALRTLMQQDGIVPLAGVYDGLSAKLAQRAGLPVAYLSGYCVSASKLGLPDVGYLTMAEMLDVARNVAGSIDIPLIADGDDAYGNHLSAGRLVRELERAGVAGVQIEDQVTPKRCGHMAGKRVVPAAQMVDKLKAAADARRDADFVIVARTDAIAVTGFDDALERALRYEAAGADLIFVEAPETDAHMTLVSERIRAPKIFNWAYGGKSPMPDTATLQRLGYQFLLCPDVVFAVSKALGDLYGEVRRTGTYAALADRMVTFDQFNEIIGLEKVADLDRRFGS